MGTILKVKNADFSENGMTLIAPKLKKIKTAFESLYAEHKRFTSERGNTDGGGDNYNYNRSRSGMINAYENELVPFILIPKNGYKFVPIQSTGNGTGTAKFSFSWVTTAIQFTEFDTYPFIGVNLAYSNDAAIPSEKSIWDFIDVELISN